MNYSIEHQLDCDVSAFNVWSSEKTKLRGYALE